MKSQSIFELQAENPAQTTMARMWLILGIAALLAAGFYSILLVLSRIPAIQDFIPLLDFFHTALVVHADLSVLIWFLAFEAMLWSFLDNGVFLPIAKFGYWLCVAGTIVIAISPFIGDSTPLMNHYIPVLDNLVFFIGLLLFTAGILIFLLRVLIFTTNRRSSSAFGFVLRIAVLITILSMAAVLTSYLGLPSSMDAVAYFETLFWGGGHILQFTHSIILLLVWLWLAHVTGDVLAVTSSRLKVYFSIAIIPVLYALPIYLLYDVASPEFSSDFTLLMKYGGLAILPLALIVIISMLTTDDVEPSDRPARSALLLSVILFSVGGVLGFMTHVLNIDIAAHYYGSIAAITMAFMGLSYHLLPHLGFNKPNLRAAKIQPWIYGGGQMVHIIGLVWSDVYGIQHKMLDTARSLDNLEETIGITMIALGGLVAIIGGLMFVVVMIKAMWPTKN